MRVAIYGRVSTRDKGQDIDMQLSELQAYAEARQWSIFRVYTDNGISGSKADRPAFLDLLSDARQRRFDAVAVWKLDRFSRSMRDLINTVSELQEIGISFVSLRDQLDFTTAAGKLQFHIISAFAEFERALISERVKSGIANAVRKGKHHGRKPLAPYQRKQIIELAGTGLSMSVISKRLSVSKGVVHKTVSAFRSGSIDISGFPVSAV